MSYRSPARWLAPAALVAAALAVLLVFSNGEKSDSPTSSTSSTQTQQRTTGTTSTTSVKATRKTYTVKAGDVLSAIAENNGLTVQRLQELNPDVDAQTLQTGQKLRLSR